MSAQYATSYEASPAYDAPAGGATTTSQDSGVIDRSYYRGIPGILKYCEMVSLIGRLLVILLLSVIMHAKTRPKLGKLVSDKCLEKAI